jgi:capsular polysaccharide biosynthesis protein
VTRTEVEAVHADFERVLARVRHPTVAVFPEVFVNRHGQIWTRDGRIYRSYNLPIPDASREAEATAPALPEAALAVETHNNIFHWFAEWFPTLAWRLDDIGGSMPVLIRDDAARFMPESLHLGAARPLEIAAAGDAVFVERLHVADRGLPMLARQEAVGGLMARLRERAVARHPEAVGRRPVYISRRDAKKRRMTNEAELEAALEQRGFDIVQMTPLSFAEQIARVAQAPRIVSAHGAGLALLAAAAPGRQVVELMPALRGSMLIRSTMAKISRIVGHSHHVWLQDIPPLTDVWTLDLDAFLRLLDRLPPAEDPR